MWLRIEKILFYTLLVLACALVAYPKYYLTGDGPSHVYNSKVMLDMVQGTARNWYAEIYRLNKSLEPNLLSQIILMGLLKFFHFSVAEKILQLMYVVAFAVGLRYLIAGVNRQAVFLSTLFYPFCFSFVFQLGFYNYSLSLALSFFVMGYYLRCAKNMTAWQALLLSVLFFCTTICHGMPAMFCMQALGIIFLFHHFKLVAEHRKEFFEKGALFILSVLPSFIVLAFFTLKKGISSVPHPDSMWQKFLMLCHMHYSVSTRLVERQYIIAYSVLLLVLLLLFFFRPKEKKIMMWTFAAFVLLVLITYLRCPLTITGDRVDFRMAFLPLLFLLPLLATVQWQRGVQFIVVVVAIIIQVGFTVLRWPFINSTSCEMEAVLQLEKSIPTQQQLLALHYNDAGAQQQFQIDGSFFHATDYFGCTKNKPQIIVQNYEAELPYFAVQWRDGKNPKQTIAGLYQGMQPLLGNIAAYELQVGRPINYIIALGAPDACYGTMTSNYQTIKEVKNANGLLLARLLQKK